MKLSIESSLHMQYSLARNIGSYRFSKRMVFPGYGRSCLDFVSNFHEHVVLREDRSEQRRGARRECRGEGRKTGPRVSSRPSSPVFFFFVSPVLFGTRVFFSHLVVDARVCRSQNLGRAQCFSFMRGIPGW